VPVGDSSAPADTHTSSAPPRCNTNKQLFFIYPYVRHTYVVAVFSCIGMFALNFVEAGRNIAKMGG
jgi:hypothetical protein